MQRRVTSAHRSDYPNPISFDPGDRLTVGRRDEEFPGWIWTRTADGNEGWAPEAILDIAADDDTSAIARETYTARELDTAIGDMLFVNREMNGWCWARNDAGREGWVPVKTTVEA